MVLVCQTNEHLMLDLRVKKKLIDEMIFSDRDFRESWVFS